MNPEWFRNPPSVLERTLRRPVLYREAIRLFLVHFLPLWFLMTWAMKWILGSGPERTSGMGFIIALIIEMFWLRWWYWRFWLPAHLRRISRIKQLALSANPVLKTPHVRTDKMNLCTSIDESVGETVLQVVTTESNLRSLGRESEISIEEVWPKTETMGG